MVLIEGLVGVRPSLRVEDGHPWISVVEPGEGTSFEVVPFQRVVGIGVRGSGGPLLTYLLTY